MGQNNCKFPINYPHTHTHTHTPLRAPPPPLLGLLATVHAEMYDPCYILFCTRTHTHTHSRHVPRKGGPEPPQVRSKEHKRKFGPPKNQKPNPPWSHGRPERALKKNNGSL